MTTASGSGVNGARGLSVRWMLFLLFLGNVLGYLDRAAFAVAAPVLSKELSLDSVHLGLLLGAFALGYAVVSYLGGYAADRFGANRVIAACAAVWSIFCAATALPLGFAGLMVVRVMFGAGEGPYTPSANKVVSETVPAASYGLTLAIISTGQPVGALLAGPVVVRLMTGLGWRMAFLAIGLTGLCWALVWWLGTRSEKPRPGAVDAAATSRRSHEARGSAWATLRGHLRDRQVMAVCYSYFAFTFVLAFLLNWLPSYLVSGRGLPLTTMGYVTTVPWFFAIVGLLLGSVIAAKASADRIEIVTRRKRLLAAGLAATGCLVGLATLVDSTPVVIALMAGAAFGIYLTGICYLGILKEIVPPDEVGGVGGLAIGSASLASLVSPPLIGWIVAVSGRYDGAFIACALVAISGAVAVMAFVTGRERSATAVG